jgi:hypothetical protein
MKTVEVTVKVKDLSPTMKLNLANHIYNSVNGNTNFTALYPTAATLQTAITVYSTALTNQQKGNKTSTSTMKDAMHKLMRTLKAMAAGVEYLSNDNETIALSSGFWVKVRGVKISSPLSVQYGKVSGSVNLKTQKTKGASYKWQYSLDPVTATSWIDAGDSTLVNHPLTGLTPGQVHWFRVALVKGNTVSDYGSPVSIMMI